MLRDHSGFLPLLYIEISQTTKEMKTGEVTNQERSHNADNFNTHMILGLSSSYKLLHVWHPANKHLLQHFFVLTILDNNIHSFIKSFVVSKANILSNLEHCSFRRDLRFFNQGIIYERIQSLHQICNATIYRLKSQFEVEFE